MNLEDPGPFRGDMTPESTACATVCIATVPVTYGMSGDMGAFSSVGSLNGDGARLQR